MKLNFSRANTSNRFRPLLAVAALASLASLPVRSDTLGAMTVTTCATLSESTFHEYTILSSTDLEAAGDVPERRRVPIQIVGGSVPC